MEFFQKLNLTHDCIFTHRANKTTCEGCAGHYDALNAFYISEKEAGHEDEICFDIRDAMNKTRLTWSKELKCCRDKHGSLFAFLVCSAVIGVLPVGFYVGFFVYQRRLDASEYVTNEGIKEATKKRSFFSLIYFLTLDPNETSRTSPPPPINRPTITNDPTTETEYDDDPKEKALLQAKLNNLMDSDDELNVSIDENESSPAAKSTVLIDLGQSDDEQMATTYTKAKASINPGSKNINLLDDDDGAGIVDTDDDDDNLLTEHPENVNRDRPNFKTIPEKEVNKLF